MSLYPRKLSFGLRWFFKFKLNGVLHRSKAIYLTKAEAKKAEAEAYQEADYHQRNPSVTQKISLLQAMNERLDYIQSRKSQKYYYESKRYLSILNTALQDVYISQIKKKDIETILQANSSRGSNTANAMLRCFKALFNHVIEGNDLDIKNPCVGIKSYAVDKRIKYVPSDNEIGTLLKTCSDDQRRLIEFIRDTGARINEALNLQGSDVTNIEVTLYTRKSANSNLVGRVLPKPNCLKGITIHPNKRVFHMWNEQPKFLERKLRQLKLPKWGFHNLRHRYASILSAQRIPIYEISKLLGHQSITTTQLYLQLLPRYTGDTLVTHYKENREI